MPSNNSLSLERAAASPSLAEQAVAPDATGGLAPRALLTFIAATVIDLGALGVLLQLGATPEGYALAAALHAMALAPLLAAGLPRSQRSLAVALTLTLPMVGAPIALLALGTRGRSEISQEMIEEETQGPPLDRGEVQQMAGGLSSCESLLAASVEERRALLSSLTRRPDANAIALLRWALMAPDNDLAVEAALALEDISASFEARLEACREELREKPSYAAALLAAETIAAAIEAGIVDPSLLPVLVREAASHFRTAAELDPVRFDEVAASQAHMELAVMRPDVALELIDRALQTARPEMRDELHALRQEAVLASHSLPWEGPSALATYRPPIPPPLTSRRLMVTTGRPAGSAPRRVPSLTGERGRSTAPRRYTLFPILGAEVTRGRV
jgi:hypothetical protein